MHKFISMLVLLVVFGVTTSLVQDKSPQPLVLPQNSTLGTTFSPSKNIDQLSDILALENPSTPLTTIATPTPEPSSTPIDTPVNMPTPTPLLVKTPAPSPSPVSPIPTPTAAPIVDVPTPPNSLSGDKIFDLTNSHRKAIGLSELIKDGRSCQLARSRAPEIMHEVQTGTMHKGLADRNLPYWNNENIAYYNTEEETVNWWVADTIHRKQLEGNFKYSCAACYKNACAQELTNFAPK